MSAHSPTSETLIDSLVSSFSKFICVHFEDVRLEEEENIVVGYVYMSPKVTEKFKTLRGTGRAAGTETENLPISSRKSFFRSSSSQLESRLLSPMEQNRIVATSSKFSDGK
jgi:hypothetical protein